MSLVSLKVLFIFSMVLSFAAWQAAEADPIVQRFTCKAALAEFEPKPDWCQGGEQDCGIGGSNKFLTCVVPGVEGFSAGLDARDLIRNNEVFRGVTVHVRPEDRSMLSGIRIIFEFMVDGVVQTFSMPLKEMRVSEHITGGYDLTISDINVAKRMDNKKGCLRRMILVVDSGQTTRTIAIGSVRIMVPAARFIVPKNIVLTDEGCGAITIK